MLSKDPKNRITAAQALQHPFLVEEKEQLQLDGGAVFKTGISL